MRFAATSTVSTTAGQASATTLDFSATTAGWVDVHYTVNGGDTQTVRMHQNGSASHYIAGGLKKGDVVEYRFTSWDTARGVAVDSAAKPVVLK